MSFDNLTAICMDSNNLSDSNRPLQAYLYTYEKKKLFKNYFFFLIFLLFFLIIYINTSSLCILEIAFNLSYSESLTAVGFY